MLMSKLWRTFSELTMEEIQKFHAWQLEKPSRMVDISIGAGYFGNKDDYPLSFFVFDTQSTQGQRIERFEDIDQSLFNTPTVEAVDTFAAEMEIALTEVKAI
jgi:hypothetical protein